VVTVRFFASARAAAGVSEEKVDGVVTVGALRADLGTRHGDGLGRILDVASFLIDGVTAHTDSTEIPPGATVDILPPFAGG
jgi:molybdopterin converting factor small subunit